MVSRGVQTDPTSTDRGTDADAPVPLTRDAGAQTTGRETADKSVQAGEERLPVEIRDDILRRNLLGEQMGSTIQSGAKRYVANARFRRRIGDFDQVARFGGALAEACMISKSANDALRAMGVALSRLNDVSFDRDLLPGEVSLDAALNMIKRITPIRALETDEALVYAFHETDTSRGIEPNVAHPLIRKQGADGLERWRPDLNSPPRLQVGGSQQLVLSGPMSGICVALHHLIHRSYVARLDSEDPEDQASLGAHALMRELLDGLDADERTGLHAHLMLTLDFQDDDDLDAFRHAQADACHSLELLAACARIFLSASRDDQIRLGRRMLSAIEAVLGRPDCPTDDTSTTARERLRDALEGISCHLSRLWEHPGHSVDQNLGTFGRMLTLYERAAPLANFPSTLPAAQIPNQVRRGVAGPVHVTCDGASWVVDGNSDRIPPTHPLCFAIEALVLRMFEVGQVNDARIQQYLSRLMPELDRCCLPGRRGSAPRTHALARVCSYARLEELRPNDVLDEAWWQEISGRLSRALHDMLDEPGDAPESDKELQQRLGGAMAHIARLADVWPSEASNSVVSRLLDEVENLPNNEQTRLLQRWRRLSAHYGLGLSADLHQRIEVMHGAAAEAAPSTAGTWP
jgi:hypothetical protein